MELLNHTPFSKGWQSSRFCDYPQEILIELPNFIRVKQIQFLSHHYKITSKIEILILTQKNTKKFKKIGYLSLDSNEKSNFQARELKSVYVDYECIKIKIILHRCYVNQLNTFCQVGLIALNILGQHTVENPLEQNPNFKYTQDNKLEDEMIYDPITLKRLKALYKAKDRAVDVEDFEEAKRIKEAIDRLKAVSSQLLQLEERKRIAIKNDDFDSAKIIKYEVERLRNAVAGINIDQNFNPDAVLPSLNTKKLNQENMRTNHEMYEAEQQDDYNQPERGFNQIDPRKIPRMNNPSQNNHYHEMPINSNMVLPNDQDIDRTKNVDHGVKFATKNKVIFNDVDEQPIKGISQDFGTAISQQIKQGKGKDVQSNNQETVDHLDDEDEDIPVNLYKYAEPLIPILTHDIVKLAFSTTWRKKEQAMRILTEEIKQHPHSKILSGHADDKIITASCGLASHCLTTNISQVQLATMEMLKVLFNRFHNSNVKGYYRGDLDRYCDNCLLLMLEKLGDSNIKLRERAENTVIEMANNSIIGHKLVFEHLISGQIKKTLVNSIKHQAGRIALTNRMVENFGINQSEIGVDSLLNFAFNGYKHNNKEVRDEAYKLIMNCYKFVGGTVRGHYDGLRQPQKDLLEEGFEQLDLGQGQDRGMQDDRPMSGAKQGYEVNNQIYQEDQQQKFSNPYQGERGFQEEGYPNYTCNQYLSSRGR